MTADDLTDAQTPPSLFDGTVSAVIFDLDGVITDTAEVHFHAWKELFDSVFEAEAGGTSFEPFDHNDYLAHVDGKPRYDGVRSMLEARGIERPQGSIEDPPDAETVSGLGNRKNAIFREVLDREGPVVFPSTVHLIRVLRDAGIATGCVSSSRNCRHVLEIVGLTDQFDHILDGNDASKQGLPGKPAPDTYLACADALGSPADRSAMVEDALSGVASGAAGGFLHVIGLDRGAGHDGLMAEGATIVVDDLGVFLPGS